MNTDISYSRHAEIRAQQRAVPAEIVELLLSHGTYVYCHGARKYFLDHRARHELRRSVPGKAYAALEKKLNTYLVATADGTVVTVGRRTRRIHH